MPSQSVHLPRVAVCLAAFNGVHWLPEQLDSILSQSGIAVTVFVSVDKSNDGTEVWFDQRALIDPRIVVLPHGGKFGGAARNFFRLLREVDFSGYDYVSFSDQDDIWLPEKISRAHHVLQRTGADGYSSNVVAFWPNGRRALIRKSQPQVQWDFLFEAAGPGCTYVLKRNLACAIQDLLRSGALNVEQVGLHDWFAYAFARAHNYRWIIDDYAGMLYRQHTDNQVGVNVGWRAFVHRMRKILSGWGLAQSLLIAKLVGLENDPFVMRWADGSRIGLGWLCMHSGRCRRRIRDRIIFALSCLALSVVKRNGQ